MKRSLILAVSVLALTAVSETLFAAEAETPAPTERAAPAAERAPAPAAERAPAPAAERAPARQRQAARTAPQQSTSSQTGSYTGVQAGGFGGGNVGGGSFADPVCQSLSSGLNNGCTPAPFNQSLNKSNGRGGVVVQWMVPATQWIMVGVAGDLSFGKNTASASQNNFYMGEPFINPNIVTSEQIQNSVSQSTSGSARLKVGFVVPLQYTSFMPYFTVGWVHSTLQGTFSYSSSSYFSFQPQCAFNPTCSSIAGSSVGWSRSSNGTVFGVGAEMPIPAFGPGVVLFLDYSRADFGSFDVNLPVAIGVVNGQPCLPSGQSGQLVARSCSTTDIGHFSSVSSNTFSVGARFKLF